MFELYNSVNANVASEERQGRFQELGSRSHSWSCTNMGCRNMILMRHAVGLISREGCSTWLVAGRRFQNSAVKLLLKQL